MPGKAQRFAVRRGQIADRADVNYSAASIIFRDVYANALFPLVALRDLVTLVQYGTSALTTEEEVGVPVLRMNNLQDDGWDLSDLKYLNLSPDELETYRLEKGDLLFNRTNSKELVGKSEVFREDGDWAFASYLIRVRVDTTKVFPDLVSAFLSTKAGRIQIDGVSRQIIGMTNVNAEELRDLVIPLPPMENQKALLADLNSARISRSQKLAEAEALLSGMDQFLLDELGLTPPPAVIGNKPFAVRLGTVKGSRIDPPAYIPFPIPSNPRHIPIHPLETVAAIDANSAPKQADDSALVPYVGLPECSLNDVREVSTRPYREAKGRSIAHVGDILFARIEPSVFNKKYVFVENLAGHEYAFLSTEFYCVRARGNEADQKFLYAMFQSSFVFNQVKGKTTGSSGRRRIDPEMFASIRIPWPAEALRQRIAAELSKRRKEARKLRNEAAREWDAAKARFEAALLGKEGNQ